jgi:NADP-dependent 3-hydroxy acid dehydrogenase YdfG
MRLAGKVAIISGAASGMGAATADQVFKYQSTQRRKVSPPVRRDWRISSLLTQRSLRWVLSKDPHPASSIPAIFSTSPDRSRSVATIASRNGFKRA